MSRAPQLSLDQLRVIAEVNGITVDDDRLAQLLPLVQALWDGAAMLDDLDLDGIEPEPVFDPTLPDCDGRG